MKLEDLIECLNRHIENKRESLGIKTKGHLILQRVIKQNNIFKLYKDYIITVWFIKGTKKYNVLTCNQVYKTTDNNEEKILKNLSIILSEEIFNWIGSEHYKQIIEGEYKSDK